MIYFNLTCLGWEFDVNKIQQQEMSSDIISCLSERIMRLPRSIQSALKVAACLGSSFDLTVFQKATIHPVSIDEFITLATENGLLYESSPNNYTWSHDQLHQAAYSLIPSSKKESTHLLIGSRIFLSSTSEEIQSYIHDIVRNMNIGMSHLRTQAQKVELARLNLTAGEKSIKSSAFCSASTYFSIGIVLLGDDWHVDNYDLAMKIFNLSAEMLIITGNSVLFQSTIEQSLIYARTFEDRLPSSHNLIRFLVSLGRLEEALSHCFKLIREFGEPDFPSEVTPEIINEEIAKTELALANFPKSAEILGLPPLTDSMKVWLMKIMNSAMLLLFATKAELASLLGCRMVQRSAEYGWSCDSAFGLYAFGHTLISIKKNVDDGYFW